MDVDNNGIIEIAVANGGPAAMPDGVREPNRLFFFPGRQYSWLKVRPVGNGTTVAKDAVGTRIRVTAHRDSAPPFIVYRTLYAGSAFSAQNGFEVHFGLADATAIDEVRLTWPDGAVTTLANHIAVNTSIVVEKGSD